MTSFQKSACVNLPELLPQTTVLKGNFTSTSKDAGGRMVWVSLQKKAREMGVSEISVTNSITLCSWWVNDVFQDRTRVQWRSTTTTAINCHPSKLHRQINRMSRRNNLVIIDLKIPTTVVGSSNRKDLWFVTIWLIDMFVMTFGRSYYWPCPTLLRRTVWYVKKNFKLLELMYIF